jgi:hypothetical protein
MTRRSLFLLALVVSAPAFALEFGPPIRVADVARTASAPFTVRSIVADGKGGAVAFGRMSRGTPGRADILAIPVEATGRARWDLASTIAVNASSSSAVAAAKTAGGYVVTFRDVEGTGYIVPVDAFLTVRAPLTLPNEEPYPLACNGGFCGGISKDSLLIIEADPNRLIARAAVMGARTVAAAEGGFVVGSVASSAYEVRFVRFDGTVTATAQFPVGQSFSIGLYVPAVAPHPLGAIALWPVDNQIRAVVVRTDGTTAATASLPGGIGPGVSDLSIAPGAGQYAIVFSGLTSYFICTCPPNIEIEAMRISEGLEVLSPPARISLGTTNGGPLVAAAGGNFIAAWEQSFFDTGSRVAVIPGAGGVSVSSSEPLALAPASQSGRGLAATSDRTLAVWSSPSTSGTVRILAARIDSFGLSLDAQPIVIGDGFGSVAVASVGHDFAVNIGSQLVAVDGDDGTARVIVGGMQSTGMLASDGAGYLLPTYTEAGYALMRVTPAGSVLWTRRLNFPYPSGIAAMPGRTMVVGAQGPALGFHIFDPAGTPVKQGLITSIEGPFLLDLASNGRDQFLAVMRDSKNLYAVRIGADGTILDPVPVVIASPPVNVAAAAPLGGHWLIVVDNRAIELPSRIEHPMPAGETLVDLAAASGGRAVLLTSRTEVVEGHKVSVVVMREVKDTGGIPPRRRGVNR